MNTAHERTANVQCAASDAKSASDVTVTSSELRAGINAVLPACIVLERYIYIYRRSSRERRVIR